MVFIIEVSLDTKKIKNTQYLKDLLIKKALKNKCEIYFFNYEFMGKNRNSYRHHFILTFVFEENEELVANFIRFVKKQRNVKFESIVYENCNYELMYASTTYLKLMDKDMSKDYIKKRKANTLFKNDSVIIKALLKC
tara:strand:+ start:492 stop:902 length:411 start_codon:yes stop_codon:yes gene_type:complete